MAMSSAFDRDSMAVFYAKRHKATDGSISEIYHLPKGAPPKEIRLVEVNGSILGTASPEPIDFGVDGGTENEHKLIVLDVTPEQWGEIRGGSLTLPPGWKLDGSVAVGRGRPRSRK
jgi:hypothetical protein